ncbi:MAG: hypothetical protein APF77_08895 [Clostridia bacterium BRH_c25]|nr:MAG: hypothetical protein APF77_08895 [Clostridia bacterium BRH_c25]
MGDRIFDAEFLKKLDTIVINVRMMMNTGSGGNRKSRSKGSSVEFSDFREYSMGDDFRRIDWNAYGRFDKLFVKLFMEEREAMVNIFIDSSRSMYFGEPKKSLSAIKLSGILSYMALNNLDRVCINSLSGTLVRQSTALNSRGMFQRCADFLENMQFDGITDLNSCIKKKEFKGSGVAIVFSDFFNPGGIEAAVKYLLYKKQDVILVHILAPEELNPAMEGQVRLLDSETGEERDISVTPALLKQYDKELNAFINNIREFCSRMGATYIQVSSAEPIEKTVFEEFTRAGIIY